MRYLIILITVLAAILTSCQPKVIPTGPWVKKIDSEELSRLVINFSEKMRLEQHLYLEDSYAAYDDNIKRICIRYSSQRLLTLEEARLQIVEIVEEFLYRLNNNSILSFELETFPFTAGNLDIRINFESFFGMYVDPLYIGQTWLQCACVDFYAFDRKDNNIDWDHHRFEPYFKSRELALLQKEAKIPYGEKIENPPKRPREYIYDRYTPYQPGLNGMHPRPTYQDVNVLRQPGIYGVSQPYYQDVNAMYTPGIYRPQPYYQDVNAMHTQGVYRSQPLYQNIVQPTNPGMYPQPYYQDVNVLRE